MLTATNTTVPHTNKQHAEAKRSYAELAAYIVRNPDQVARSADRGHTCVCCSKDWPSRRSLKDHMHSSGQAIAVLRGHLMQSHTWEPRGKSLRPHVSHAETYVPTRWAAYSDVHHTLRTPKGWMRTEDVAEAEAEERRWREEFRWAGQI
eukprot:COSAG02_NODE_452_length_22047_cov_20.154502_10_plen_149_part_00